MTKAITKLMLTLMLLIVCIGVNAEKRYLTFSCADYCAAQWNSETSTLTWGTGGWNSAWTFMAADGISGDLSEWESLHLNAKNFVNSQENKLTVVFKKNDGSNPPSGPTKEFVVSPDDNGDITIDLKNVAWGDCDITNIQDLTIYGGARVDETQSGSVVVTEAYFEKTDAVDPTEDVLPIDIQFGPDYNSTKVGGYDNTWTATKDGKTWTITNFNNNNNNWNFIKCGRKNAESVASIASPAINAVVTNYVITLDKVANVTSATLTIQGENTEGEVIDITDKFVAGDVNIPVVGANGSTYTLTINNASASGNGSVQISKITLYGQGQYVGPVHIENTAETAYTVAEAVALIEAGDALSETVFVKGIVSKVDNFNDQYKSITYWISADGSTEGQQFECYSGKGLEGADFASIDDVEVGAEVIVKGTMKKFVPEEGDPIYEFNYNNELVSYKAPVKPLFADGKYYIYNKGVQQYLAAGASWGTHAVVNADGLDYGITFADGKYTIDSQISNGGANNFLNGSAGDGPWNDGGAFGWVIVKTEDGDYTISNGTKFIAAAENGGVTFVDDATAETAHWAFKTLDERIAELASATAEAPVNATFLIQDANFGRNDLRKSAWTMVAGNQNMSGGDNTNNNAESFHSNFTLSQVLANAPAGKYQMTAQGFYRQDGSDNEHLPVFYANDKTATFPAKTGSENSMADASASFTAGNYTIDPIAVTVFEDGQLTVGAKLEGNTNLWCIFDNFRLTYLSSEIPASEFKPAYEAALAAAQAALADEAYAIVTGEEKTALAKAIEDYTTVEETVEAYKAAISALNAATTAFTSAKADYATLANAKESVKTIDFSVYPYASEAKIAAAVAALNATATSAADAKTKAQTVLSNARKAVESNALLEGTYGAVNYSDSVADLNADKNIWTSGSIGTNQGQGYTDGNGEVCGKYLDGGWSSSAGANINLTKEIKLPAGKYILTTTARGSASLTEYSMSIAGQTVTLPHNGADASTGVFGNGWDDAFIVFETTGDPLTLELKAISEATQQWVSINRFRLAQFGVAGEDAPAPVAPEGWTNLIENGNLAGESVVSFFSKEANGATTNSTIVAMAGKDNSRGIVVKSADNPSQAWDTQFWIKFNEALPMGSKLHVEFDYVANKAAKGTTQAHGNPGDYQHWAGIGDVNFTTEWQHFSTDIEVSADMATGNNGKGLLSIAFNLAEEKTATVYRFDNFGAWAQIPEPVKEWKNLIVNSDMEGESMECFYVSEQGVGGPFVAVATEGIGKDGSKAVKVQSADSPTNNWDTQFFIRLPYQLPAGTQYKVSFDYKADKAGDFETQSHANPGQYIHWACCGGGSFTTDWQTFTAEGAIPSECDGSQGDGFVKIFQSIAFNLAKNKVATQFIFDNVKFEVPEDVAATLTPNPDQNPVPYPTGIQTVKSEKNAEGIFNLNGQKVMKTQKGLYIMNGKKVVVK